MNEFERRALDIAEMSAYLAMYARQNQKIVDIEYFTYNTTTGPINAGGVAQSIIQIQSDSDFVVQYMSGVATVAGTTFYNPLISVQITDTGSGKTLFSNPALMNLVMGSQGFPFVLSAPRVFAPNTNVKFDFVNRGVTNYTSVDVSMIGARIYYAD